ncbi:acid phosphatase [Sphingomonas sp. ABOLH]|nr:MAG: acid phosphatase [Sphingomonas sp.]RSV25031.1 acid phosphatase [Sphingomonas sp. ABOLH]
MVARRSRIPAQAGIQGYDTPTSAPVALDPRLRGDTVGAVVKALTLATAAFALSGCVVAVGNQSPAPVAPATVAGVPAGMQYLYGSGEAVAASRQTYSALVRYVQQYQRDRTTLRRMPLQAVLAPGATLAQPTQLTCTGKAAVVFDVDETVLLNTGYEYSDARGGLSYDASRWERWERSDGRATRAVPGAVEGLAALRAAGVTVVFNSNRNAATASYTEAVLNRAGLGPARHGETLFLKGDAPGGSGKDARRALIAAKYCVVALVGDQLGDFTDLFNAGLKPAERRAAADSPAIAPLWGNGWFLLPNPVYGTALAGDFDDVFPNDLRWSDPGAPKE